MSPQSKALSRVKGLKYSARFWIAAALGRFNSAENRSTTNQRISVHPKPFRLTPIPQRLHCPREFGSQAI
jgi:hypothetical protein